MLRVILAIAHNSEDDTLSLNPAQSHAERKIETWFLTAKCEYRTQQRWLLSQRHSGGVSGMWKQRKWVFDHQEKHMIRPILAR